MNQQANTLRVGVFELTDIADQAVQRLVDAGCPADSIAVVCSDRAVRKHFPDLDTPAPAGETHPERAWAGGAIGALLGGATAVATATTGGLALVAAGALFTLAGAGAGSFIGAMTARGVEKEVADFYDRALEKDRILVAVDCTKESAPEAERIFDELGSESIRLPDG